jgi:predicted nucleotidyltransferase
MDSVRKLLAQDPRIAYALVFGSSARGTAHAGSDVDIALGLDSDQRLSTLALGELIAQLERACGRRVDILLISEAPPAVAYRAFRDGRVIVEKSHRRLAEDKARAILEYLDFRPIEQLATRGVLTAAARGR